MKKKIMTSVVAAVLCASMIVTPSCIGSFSLTNRLLSWNRHVGNKFLNELVFFCFWVLPVYEVCGVADVLVLNSIEFWSGRNPVVAQADREVEGSDGYRYRIHQDNTGYDITNLTTGEQSRLQFNEEDLSWSVEAEGQSDLLFQFVDDSHVSLPDGQGGLTTVEISAEGLYAYTGIVSAQNFACR